MTFAYSDYVATLANLTAYDPTDINFLQILPSAIDYSENRIYREADLLATVVRDQSGTLTPNSRSFTLPVASGQFNVIRQLNVLVSGVRQPLTPVSTEVLDTVWPSETAPATPSIPTLFAVLTSSVTGRQTVLVGPPPDSSYNVEVVGTVTPTALSASNTTTYLTNVLWDVFIAASMVYLSGWMKNFGAQSDNPAQAMSWETQYKTLFASADLVDARQKFQSVSWTSAQPEPAAQPQRG
jgi:hypothetical protein